MRKRMELRVTTSVLASCAALLVVTPAMAQQTAAKEVGPEVISLEKIIVTVTANKRSEPLNKVPIAVSAFTDEDRTIRGINSTQEIAAFTPSVSISDRDPRVNIRGIGRVTNVVGTDPGVANYVDGFYTSESDVIGSSDFNIARVEVLRGPQGTLYGRNSIGGAVNVISKRPTKEFVSEGRAFINDYKQIGGAASASGPISDTLRFRVSAIGAHQNEGYVHNLSGPDQTNEGYYNVQGQLEADITPNLNAVVRVGSASYNRRPRPITIIDSYENVPYHGGLVANPQFGLTNNPSKGDPFTVDYNYGGRQKLDNQYQVTTNVKYETPKVIVQYIGGYSQYDYSQTRDLDQTSRTSFRRAAFGTTFPVSTNYVESIGEDKRWWSSELNFLSKPGDRLDWIFGLFYYHETLDQPVQFRVPDVALFENPVPKAGVPPIDNPNRAYYSQRGQLSSKAKAVFGQTTWRFTPELSIDLGARYTKDEKRGTENQFQIFYDVTVDPGHTYTVLNKARELSGSWDAYSGDASINYQPSDDTLAYGKISRGYKSGGFTLGALAPNPYVGPEHVKAYEIGLKQRVGKLQINSAIYYNDYTDLQAPVLIQVAPGAPPQNVLYNVPKSRSYGFETEATIRPVKPLSLSLIYSYLNATFQEFSGVVDVTTTSPVLHDLSGENLPQSPHHRLTLNGVYSFGAFDFSPTYSYVSEQFYGVFNTRAYRAPSYSETALRLTYTAPQERYRVIASVNNLFDKTSYSYVTSGAAAAGSLLMVTPRLPRVFWLEARVKF